MNKPLFSFSVMSDLHFMAYKDPERPVEWVPFLRQEIAYIRSLRPDFIVCNGDLTNGKERDYRLAMAAFRECPMPVYYTMGNHEYYGCYEDPGVTAEAAQRRFLEQTGMPSIFYEKVFMGIPFLFMSTENYTPDSNDAAWLSDNQLNWLDERLAASEGRPAFVFLHQPVNDTVAGSVNTCRESERLSDILARHPGVLLFSGHTHCRMDREDQIVRRNGTVFVGGGCMYEEVPQSRWVDVYPDRAVLRLLCHREHRILESFDTIVSFA
jgi:3',5'-cyclic AMP phosphodiesterase CpdA